MPKVIDNFVLQDKIGSGQFGDVYKGFNQDTHLEVAIKTIKRETIKGKFYQLLQNEIKVLKTCDNPYIMKLYALKKTANHYYLILQFCNGGDMLAKLKKYKRLDQNQVIKYFCQILTGFQTLVKHKIMHRDFKLANILLHDDNIKIADFGFSKLLTQQDYTTTMLGSPLNMAPQVLGGNKYNNKADIWSIGACIYQMLVGKPPYMANNMVDLLKNINSKPLNFPSELKINSVLIDVLKKMLTPDVKKRISWNDLFSHPINRYLDNQIRKEIDLQLIEDQSLMINTSKYYLKKNLVVSKPEDIEEKAEMNDELMTIIKTGEKSRISERTEQDEGKQTPKKWRAESKLQTSVHDHQKQYVSKQIIKKQESLQNFSHIFRKNSKKILHYRNVYAFLAAAVDEIIQFSEEGSELAAYVIIKKILLMIKWLGQLLDSKQPLISGFQRWGEYKTQHEYQQVKQYIKKEENVFTVFGNTLQSTVKQKILKGELGNEAKSLMISKEAFSQEIYSKLLQDYVKPFVRKITHQTLCTKDIYFCLKQWRHVQNVLISLNFEEQFGLSSKSSKDLQSQQESFDFTKFYENKQHSTPEQILLKVEKVLSKYIKKQIK